MDRARLVVVQFNFSNPKGIPPLVGRIAPESKEDHENRKQHATGRLIIEPTQKISIEALPDGLEEAGYQLVDAFAQRRPSPHKAKPVYYTVRFTFAANEVATPSDAFKARRDDLRAEFRTLCLESFWRVRAFRNPFFENDTPVPDEFTVALNFEARVARLLPNGDPVVAWQKDVAGNRTGGAPIQIEPDGFLEVQDGSVVLLG